MVNNYLYTHTRPQTCTLIHVPPAKSLRINHVDTDINIDRDTHLDVDLTRDHEAFPNET